MKKKYFNDAIIGNENVIASFSKRGELLKFFIQTPIIGNFRLFSYRCKDK